MKNTSELSVVLLAAGLSSRMAGRHKLLLPFGGHTLLEQTFLELGAAKPGEILVVTGHEENRVRAVLAGHAVHWVHNPDYAAGMSSSIRAGVAAAAPDTAGYMIALADMPLISAGEYRRMIKTFFEQLAVDPAAIVRPRYGGTWGNPVLFSARYRAELLALEYPEGARPILQAHPQHLRACDMPTDAVLLDADTEEGYRLLLARQG